MASALLFPFRLTFKVFLVIVQLLLSLWFFYTAYDIRMYPIQDFGMIIHEFDPWFNYRAAEYMAENGLSKFFKWYDYDSWYPIGRPIGTTIYPGMQMAAYGIREAMLRVPEVTYEVPSNSIIKALRWISIRMKKEGFSSVPVIPKKFTYVPMSVNDICCMIPPWFGSLASLFTGLLTFEISRSTTTAVLAIGIMAVIPAHLMRSVGGEFDNEAVAMAAITCTFWLWLRSLRTPSSWPWGIPAGISYIYMVLAWGGYIFVINMVGVHALMMVALGRFNSGIYKAYTLFFVIGTLGAIQIPVVGWQPLRSLEQLGPLLVFFGYQALAFCDVARWKSSMSTKEFVLFRIKVFLMCGVAFAVVATLLYPTGYFGPLSARIRGLFVKHTKTGNPLVDSVAEHQPASAGIYSSYLGLPLGFANHGVAVCLYKRTTGCYFAALYAAVAIHFSAKMSRLILICGPICAIACALWFGFVFDFIMEPVLLLLGKKPYQPSEPIEENDKVEEKVEKVEKAQAKGKSKAKAKEVKPTKKAKTTVQKARPLEEFEEEHRPGGMMQIKTAMKGFIAEQVGDDTLKSYVYNRVYADTNYNVLFFRLGISSLVIYMTLGMTPSVSRYVKHCHSVARSLSDPQVVSFENDGRGGRILVDDYLKGYEWVDKNTPKDSRVIAWWDYGYQITGIAKRASIADGNTWNHEHIATLGRTLTSPEKKAWNVIRHIADYLLVWAGGGGDDLAKSPHLARIGNSVFPDHCGDDDPNCNKFSFFGDGSPMPMMAKSLLYKAVMHNVEKGVKLDKRLFKEVHTTQRGRMRIFQIINISQESKDWVADPKNRVCDAPGSWYCVGQYPPALDKLISKRRSFSQVEDFNKAGEKSAYTKMIEKQKATEL